MRRLATICVRLFASGRAIPNARKTMPVRAIQRFPLSDIDTRIKQLFPWSGQSPALTWIVVPQDAREAIKKLEQHPDILVVGKQITPKGEQFFEPPAANLRK